MEVRFARREDKKQVLALMDAFTKDLQKQGVPARKRSRLSGAVFDEVIDRKDTMIFVAVDGRKVAGLATFYLLPNIRHGRKRGHIEDMFVAKSYRRMGAGSAIMNAIKSYCKKNGINVVKLDSGLQLKPAHKFYEKHGGKHTEKMYRFDI